MDVVWMAKSNEHSLDQSGQSVVEYILLLVVITSLAYSLYSHPKFKQFFGRNGFFESMKIGISHTYRYGIEGFDDANSYEYTDNKHKTYYNAESNSSRFFSPVTEYGN